MKMGVEECQLNGGHRFGSPVRVPLVVPEGTEPRYWTLLTCERCGRERYETYDCTKNAPQPLLGEK